MIVQGAANLLFSKALSNYQKKFSNTRKAINFNMRYPRLLRWKNPAKMQVAEGIMEMIYTIKYLHNRLKKLEKKVSKKKKK